MVLGHTIAVLVLRRFRRLEMDEWTAGDISDVLNWGRAGWMQLEEIPGRIALRRLEVYNPRTTLPEQEILKILTPSKELIHDALGQLIYNGTLEVRVDANTDHEQIGWDPMIWVRTHPSFASHARDLTTKMVDPKR